MSSAVLRATFLSTLLSLTSSQGDTGYLDATCNNDGIIFNYQTNGVETLIGDVLGATPTLTDNSGMIISGSANNDGSTAILEGIAVLPGVANCGLAQSNECVYAMYTVDGGGPNLFLGLINIANDEIEEIGEISAGTGGDEPVFTDIAFDCLGTLLAIDSETRDTFSINITTGEPTASGDGTGLTTCAPFTDCEELLVYDFDRDSFVRISSQSVDQNYILCDGIEVADPCYNITDAAFLCSLPARDQGGSIAGAQYIGNGLILISCDGLQAGDARVVLLNLTGHIFDIGGAGTREIDLGGARTAGPVLNLEGDNFCASESCASTEQPTSSPSDMTEAPSAMTSAPSAVTTAPSMSTLSPSMMTTTDDGSGSDSDSESGASDDSDSADAALMEVRKEDASDLWQQDDGEIVNYGITLDLSATSAQLLWLVFALFGVTNLTIVWCVFRKKATDCRRRMV